MNSLTYQSPPKLKRSFKVGEIVVVCDREGKAMSRFAVARAGKQVIRLNGDERRFRASDGWWIGGEGVWPWPSIRQLTKAENVEALQTLLMMVLQRWPSKAELSRWTDEERIAVEYWAGNEILAANDNPVRRIPRPKLLNRWV